MESNLITGLEASKPIRAVRRRSSASEDVKDTESEGDKSSEKAAFEVYLRSITSASGENSVSEEELFAALVQDRIKELKGDEALAKYQEYLADTKASHTRADGFVGWEKAARLALKQLRDDGTLTKEEADKIHSEAFDGAQLDDNKDALFDSRGGPGDPTVAVAKRDDAMQNAQARLVDFAAGTIAAVSRPLDGDYSQYDHGGAGTSLLSSTSVGESASGNPVDGASGFLYKPVSESDGRLVVLLPSDLTGKVLKVLIKSPEDEVLEEGAYRGVGNGDREHFRFSKPGAGYPNGLTVEAQMKDGSVKTYKIDDSSMRYD